MKIKDYTAGAEIDAAVHAALGHAWPESRCGVCGWAIEPEGSAGCTTTSCSLRPPPSRRADEPPCYSTDPLAMLVLIDQMRSLHGLRIYKLTNDLDSPRPWRCALEWGWGVGRISSMFAASFGEESMQMAVCRAFLHARRLQDTEGQQ